MSVNLYPHQEKIKTETRAAFGRVKSVLLQGATGIGKTNISVSIILDAIKKGSVIWFVAPRKELIKQTAFCMESWGIMFSYIASGYEYNPFSQVQIVSLQTAIRRLDNLVAPDLCIIDEIHFGGLMLDKLVSFLKKSECYIAALSASPWRLSGEGLGKYCQEMVHGPSVRWLIDNKYLSAFRLFAPSSPDLSGIAISGGDYSKDQLSERMEQDRVLIGSAVKYYKDHAMGKISLAYCTSIKHSEIIAESFRAANISAVHIDGTKTDAERSKIIQAFARREILVLTSCDLLTFGFDLSIASGMDVCVEAMSDLRPTKSLALQLQKWGRVLRKKNEPALIFDHASNVYEHGLPDDEREWSLEDRIKRRGGGERAMPVRQCTACFFCFKPAPLCPACGYMFPIEYREVAEVDGELEEIAAIQIAANKNKRREVGRAKTVEDLERIADERGYHWGWVKRQCAMKKIYYVPRTIRGKV